MTQELRNAYFVLLVTAKYSGVNRTSLNKICFFLDAQAVLKSGKPLTSFRYIKLPYGPVPDGIRSVVSAFRDLEVIREDIVPEGPYLAYNYSIIDSEKSERLIAKAQSSFDVTELKLIDEGILVLKGKTASQLSAISHDFECWTKAAWHGEIQIAEAAVDQNLAVAMAPTKPVLATSQPELF